MSAGERLGAGRRTLREELLALEGRALRGRPRSQAISEANELLRMQALPPVTSKTVSDWFTRGVPAKDFESLWSLVQVLVDWSTPHPPGGGARAGQRAARRAYWKTLWNQARDSRGPEGASPSDPTHGRYAISQVPVSFPHQVGVLPSKAACFQDRHSAALLAAVSVDGRTRACQILVGMGGVGKTQLAAEHARNAWRDGQLDLLVWITATSRRAIVEAYAQAGTDLLGADPADPQRAATEFLAWLEPKPGAVALRWHVVLDDVATPADLRGLLPPTSAHGSTLVTTRRRDAALTRRGQLIQVGLFTTTEATAYLAAAGRHEPVEQLACLAENLGHLPLALSQAVAYLDDTALDCTAYRALLSNRARRLVDLLPEPEALPDQQPATVAAAWALSIEHADKLRPAGVGRPMLHLASVLDPNGIPQTVLTSAPALAHLTKHRTPGSTPVSDSGADVVTPVTVEQAHETMRVLHRLNLIDHTPDTPHQAVRIHQLIQRTVRDPLASDLREQLVRSGADALSAAWPAALRDRPLAQALRANTEALRNESVAAFYQLGVHEVLFHTADSFGRSGDHSGAVEFYNQVLHQATQHLDPDHLDRLRIRHRVCLWRRVAGEAASTLPAIRATLDDAVEVLGPGHSFILELRHELALCQGEAGDAAAAADAFDKLLAKRTKTLGPGSYATLITRFHCHYWQGMAGDSTGAVAALVELLPEFTRAAGPDHSDVLATRSTLAWFIGESGDTKAALDAYTALLPHAERVLGPDDPQMLAFRGNLAYWTGQAGDPTAAMAAYELLLLDKTRIHGPDHSGITSIRESIAYWAAQAEQHPLQRQGACEVDSKSSGAVSGMRPSQIGRDLQRRPAVD